MAVTKSTYLVLHKKFSQKDGDLAQEHNNKCIWAKQRYNI